MYNVKSSLDMYPCWFATSPVSTLCLSAPLLFDDIEAFKCISFSWWESWLTAFGSNNPRWCNFFSLVHLASTWFCWQPDQWLEGSLKLRIVFTRPFVLYILNPVRKWVRSLLGLISVPFSFQHQKCFEENFQPLINRKLCGALPNMPSSKMQFICLL